MVFEEHVKKFQKYERIAEEVGYIMAEWTKPIFEKNLETYG